MDEPIWTSRNRRPIPVKGTPEGVAVVATAARILARIDRDRAQARATSEEPQRRAGFEVGR